MWVCPESEVCALKFWQLQKWERDEDDQPIFTFGFWGDPFSEWPMSSALNYPCGNDREWWRCVNICFARLLLKHVLSFLMQGFQSWHIPICFFWPSVEQAWLPWLHQAAFTPCSGLEACPNMSKPTATVQSQQSKVKEISIFFSKQSSLNLQWVFRSRATCHRDMEMFQVGREDSWAVTEETMPVPLAETLVCD